MRKLSRVSNSQFKKSNYFICIPISKLSEMIVIQQKGYSSAISCLYSCPMTNTCLVWNFVSSFAGVGACIQASGET